MSSDPQPTEIYRAKNLPEAQVIRIALEQAGVACFIDGELLQGAVGELPMGWVTAPRIKVDASQASLALEIIRGVELQRTIELDDLPEGMTRCLACGHPMYEIEDQCNSCGWTFLEEDVTQAEDASDDD